MLLLVLDLQRCRLFYADMAKPVVQPHRKEPLRLSTQNTSAVLMVLESSTCPAEGRVGFRTYTYWRWGLNDFRFYAGKQAARPPLQPLGRGDVGT